MSLTWGFRQSFREYIGSLPDGTQILKGGAVDAGDGRVIFASDGIDEDGDRTVMRFTGEVVFYGHGGFLDVALRDPWVEVNGGRGVITIAGPRDTRVPLAEFDGAALHADAREVEVTPRLTFGGSRLFNDVYPAGAELDGATISRHAR